MSVVASLLFAFALSSSAPSPAAPAREAEPPQVSAACRQAMQRDWQKIMDENDDARAVALVVGLETVCAQDRAMLALLMTYHSELDVQAGRHAEAAARLARAPLEPQDGIWPTSRWLYLRVLEVTGDAATFRAVRDAFVAEHDRALQSHPRHRMRKVERFETPHAFIDGYEGVAEQGMFRRLAVFVATPKNGGMPMTLTLTRSVGVEAIMGDGKAVFFLDLYPCGSHVNMGGLDGTAARPPTYAQARAEAVKIFSEPLPDFQRQQAPRNCGFQSFMLPGFDPAQAEED